LTLHCCRGGAELAAPLTRCSMPLRGASACLYVARGVPWAGARSWLRPAESALMRTQASGTLCYWQALIARFARAWSTALPR
jgi:hypothetical protein